MPDPTGGDDDVVRAILEVHRQTARAHSDYLAITEQSIKAIGAMPGSAAPADPAPPDVAPQRPVHPPAIPTAEPAPTIDTGPIADPVPTANPVPTTEDGPSIGSAPITEPAQPADLPPGSVAGTDLESTLLSVVAEKTGYPVEMLSPDMRLDTDLGLDSITRAQVFAALRPMFPQLETLDRTTMAELATVGTVGEIAARLRAISTERPAATAAAPARPRRQIVELAPAPPRGPTAAPSMGTLAIIGDDGGVAEELAQQLAARNVVAAVYDTAPPDTDGVVFLGGLGRVGTAEEAWAVQSAAFRAARVVASRMTAAGGLFVTVQDTGGFGLRHADRTRSWLGGLAALTRTARWEWPQATTTAIDCATEGRSAAEIATAIADELLTGRPLANVYLAADGSRWTLDISESDPTGRNPLSLGERPVLLVAGGARGITAAAIIALARQQPADFVLCGRSADAPADTVTALQATGSRIRYLAVDVRDRQRLGTELDRIRDDWGPITGLVHGAGVLADGRIEHKTDEQFERVFSTKTAGLRALLGETRQDPLRLIVAFSSVSGTVGNLGQSDYAMANETLNHVLAAEQARRPGATVRSLIWGPWRGGMVTPAVEETLALAGLHPMSIDEGVRSFLDELDTRSADPRVILAVDSLREDHDAGRA